MIRLFVALAIVVCLSFAIGFQNSVSAAVVYDVDFNTVTGTPGDFNLNYDQADPGGISVKSYSASTGSDGTRAMQVDFDTTTDPFSVSYFTNLGSSMVNPPTSTNTADYTLQFDVRIEGFDADDSQVFSQYSIKLGDEDFGGSFNATATYQTITTSLSALTNSGAGTFSLADFSGTQQFRVAFLGLNNKFDTDTNNSYFVDNIQLIEAVAVPEPSSLAVIALGCLTTFTRRRRKSIV